TRYLSSLVPLRIDAWLSLIFESGATLNNSDDEEAHTHCSLYNDLTKFSLILIPTLCFPCSFRYSRHYDPIHIGTACLKIGSTVLLVTKELLSLHSDFFST
ncbi:hypothetical protein PFISCL1PPCAC_25522, partial [Pristionchus fissidentatus]